MFKVNSRSNRRLGAFNVNFEYKLHVSSFFFLFAAFKHVIPGWNTLLPLSKIICVSELHQGTLPHIRRSSL